MKEYRINLRFALGRAKGLLYVSKPKNGDRACASGFTRTTHGCGAEIHLLHLMRKKLEGAGIILCRKRISQDQMFAHMFGDDYMNYLRTPYDMKLRQPNIWIIDENYAIRSSADQYNSGEEVLFRVQGDIFQKESEGPLQPDWWQKLKGLCDRGGVPCDVSQALL